MALRFQYESDSYLISSKGSCLPGESNNNNQITPIIIVVYKLRAQLNKWLSFLITLNVIIHHFIGVKIIKQSGIKIGKTLLAVVGCYYKYKLKTDSCELTL